MDLLILGKDSNEKGSQLEHLTKYLLQYLGYKEIVTNEKGAGGHEIDVRAEIVLPSLGKEIKHRVICECKAHKSPIKMNDWLKFLGKIYLEESQLKSEVTGCFIALSGVNGNVSGNYDLLQRHRANIQLITGNQLVQLLGKIYCLIPTDALIIRLRKFTSRQFVKLSLVYYHHKIYWLVEFMDSCFSLLTHLGDTITSDHEAEVKKLVSQSISAGQYINLEAEAAARKHTFLAEKIVIGRLMLLNGEGDSRQVYDELRTTCYKAYELYSYQDLYTAAEHLSNKQWFKIDNSLNTWRLLPENEHLISLYRYFLTGETVTWAIGSPFYDQYINSELLSKICKIQGGIEIPENRVDSCIKLLRWSPKALAWALYPDPFLVGYQRQGLPLDKRIIDSYFRYFIGKLIDHFNADFQRHEFYKYFYELRGLRETDTIRRILIKGTEDIEIELGHSERLEIGPVSPNYGGGFIMMWLIDDSPELSDSVKKEDPSKDKN